MFICYFKIRFLNSLQSWRSHTEQITLKTHPFGREHKLLKFLIPRSFRGHPSRSPSLGAAGPQTPRQYRMSRILGSRLNSAMLSWLSVVLLIWLTFTVSHRWNGPYAITKKSFWPNHSCEQQFQTGTNITKIWKQWFMHLFLINWSHDEIYLII